MADRFKFDLVSDQTSSSSSKSRRSYSQRNVSSLQQELTKNRKMINVKTSTAATLNRTLSFKPLPVTNVSLANVENTPVKIIPIKKLSFDFDTSSTISSSQVTIQDNEFVEETPIKEDDDGNDMLPSDIMAREIQRLSLRLRSSTSMYNVPVLENQPSKPVTLHLSQVVNRVSRCNYVLRRFVREAQKYSPKLDEIRSASQPILSKAFTSSQSYEKGRRRLFVDSPKQQTSISISEEHQPPITPRKASGVIKQLFSSPSSSFKRTLPSPNNSSTNTDKRQRLF
ncbi:unnamed protein product [Rotaria sp. Silwood1]|nr:unnamed protein product [Rotaria sp. Silwood1]CAF1559447.1 unnamed protein product [Rotaria sp. Silwood1]CAF3642802.1 unnamed protein product [Rotaria sp. Silwood1]CAF3665520.1 unnamed protein product [Rotaria sp. Silwood1]CAF4636750.1 unnamed protein product [Rotaria sp. Silwood1]